MKKELHQFSEIPASLSGILQPFACLQSFPNSNGITEVNLLIVYP
ncbi:MAG TPA: hypothetical protein VD908_06070 [Cytophagales bacterium]|nr:hypothetical protein [Cytophagales bacterium]